MDAQALVAALAALSRTATGEVRSTRMLSELCALAEEVLAVDAVGVMITEAEDNLFVEASSEPAQGLERAQESHDGPCRDAMRTREVVLVDNLALYSTVPEYRDQALRAGFGSAVAIPLVSRGRCWGVLDLYRFRSGPWPDDLLESAKLLADVAVSYIVMASDRDLARAMQSQLTQLALHDPLTGLANRTMLFDRLGQAVATAHRRGQAVAVLFIDLDRFKQINDSFGHAAGDAVLTEVSARLRQSLRAEDTLARLAGDEFVWVCADVAPTDPGVRVGQVAVVIERIRQIFDSPIRLGASEITVSASIGVAISADKLTPEELLSEADAAMYAAKARCPGGVSVRDHTHPDGPDYARQLERDLVHAVERDELVMHYQPIVAAGTRQVVAVEALLRWARRDGQLVDACDFIDIATRNGLITSIGRWVVDQACRQARDWIDTAGQAAPPVVFVNLSARELADSGLPDVLGEAIERHRLPAPRIGLEILEDNFADPSVLARISQLRAAGHPLSIDDFGTGYSSLSRLLDFQVDYTKIDKAFTAGLPFDHRRTAVISEILNIAATLSTQVIVEGVETEAQERHLVASGCRLLQGYRIGRPAPAGPISDPRQRSELSARSRR